MKAKQQKLRKSLMERATLFWRDERGQSTTEYILILSVVVMIAMKFKATFSTKLMGAVDKLGGEIDSAMTE